MAMITDEGPIALRMRRQAMLTAVLTIAPLSIIGVAMTARNWWEGLVVAGSFLLVLGVLREWNLDAYPRRSVLALLVTTMAWMAGALLMTNPLGFFPLALVGALIITRAERRIAWTAVFALAVASMGAVAFVLHPFTAEHAIRYVLTPLIGVAFVSLVIVSSERAWLLVRRAERVKEMETQLAVARERVRFVDDLHDIQGQSLHLIKLKSVIAYRMVRDEPERAEAELREIRRLAREAISQTRDMAYARHELNLAAEIENAKRLCESAGIAVSAHLDLGQGETAPPLLAHVLREATTNLLRHARPAVVEIAASAVHVEVANDGVEGQAKPESGLARLRERVHAAGGVMTTTREEHRFLVRARLVAEHLVEATA